MKIKKQKFIKRVLLNYCTIWVKQEYRINLYTNV